MTVVVADGRLPERAPRRARRPYRPDARPGDRRPSRSRSCCSRSRTTAGTASTTGTSGSTGGSSAGGFRDVSLDTEFTADEVTTPVVQERARARSSRSTSDDRCRRRLPVGRASSGWSSTSCRSSGACPDADGVWIAGGYSGHGNVLGFACGRLVARAILGEHDPKLELFEPARLLVH